jgi:hypothetical protein
VAWSGLRRALLLDDVSQGGAEPRSPPLGPSRRRPLAARRAHPVPGRPRPPSKTTYPYHALSRAPTQLTICSSTHRGFSREAPCLSPVRGLFGDISARFPNSSRTFGGGRAYPAPRGEKSMTTSTGSSHSARSPRKNTWPLLARDSAFMFGDTDCRCAARLCAFDQSFKC